MKNKGFTLVELLAVIAIMALIAGISIPNIVNMVDKGKKESYIKDAKAMVAKAKYMANMDKYQDYFVELEDEEEYSRLGINIDSINDYCAKITIDNLGFDADYEELPVDAPVGAVPTHTKDLDPYSYPYIIADSYVLVCDGTKYYVALQSDGKCLSKGTSCGIINISELSPDYVIDYSAGSSSTTE